MRELNQEHLTYDKDGWWSATTDETYWGELPQGEFRFLLEKVKRDNDFDFAVLDFFRVNPRKDLYPYITDIFGRSSWHELINARSGGVAVDLGAGLGAISEFLATRYARVYSIEGCRDRCEFLSLRKAKKSLDNVTIVQGGVHQLPLHDSSVDLVVCNGVLEWVGLDRAGEVRPIQVDFLREAARVLKKDGILYVGIENRFALPYFLGAPDHSGVRFTSLLPRPVASLVVKAFSGVRNFSVGSSSKSYRTYTYSKKGYGALLAEAGFTYRTFYHVEPSYDLPSFAYPSAGGDADLKRFYKMFGSRFVPLSIQQVLCSNFFIFTSKEELDGRLRDRPIYFGYFDRSTLDRQTIRRRDKHGCMRDEPLVNGIKLLDLPRYARKKIRTADIIHCYENCHLVTPPTDASSEHGRITQIMETVLGPHLPIETMQMIREQILLCHLNKPYHGDFWLGNIIMERKSQILSVIDLEPQLFGSPELDVVDFAIDYLINTRERQGFRIDLLGLYEHFGILTQLSDLITIALARQVLRYSPVHRSNILVYRYLELLKNYVATGCLMDSGVSP